MRRLLLMAPLLTGCADPDCRPMIEAQLYFGSVGDMAFASFLDRDVTPRFPDGLTVLDGAGRWRTPAGALTQERSKLVLIVAPGGPATVARLQEIRLAYKMQFHQQSVGLVMEPVCADF